MPNNRKQFNQLCPGMIFTLRLSSIKVLVLASVLCILHTDAIRIQTHKYHKKDYVMPMDIMQRSSPYSSYLDANKREISSVIDHLLPSSMNNLMNEKQRRKAATASFIEKLPFQQNWVDQEPEYDLNERYNNF